MLLDLLVVVGSVAAVWVVFFGIRHFRVSRGRGPTPRTTPRTAHDLGQESPSERPRRSAREYAAMVGGWKLAWGAAGVLSLLAVLPAAGLCWHLLPPGTYPRVVVGLPALPFLALGMVCLSKAGLPADQFLKHPVALAIAIALIGLLVLSYTI